MEKVKVKIHNQRVRLIIIVVSMLFLAGTNAGAVDLDMSSTLNPVGSGARSTGMGGAFIGVADDATAASWNPAGLIQLEKPEVSVVYSHFHRTQSYGSSSQPGIANEDSIDTDSLNYTSVALPFVLLNRNMIVSINYQRLYEINKRIQGKILGESTVLDFDRDSRGHLYSLSPAMAVQIIPGLYLGATLNLWDNDLGSNGWESRKTIITDLDLVDPVFTLNSVTTTVTKQNVSFEGINQHFGFLWDISDSLTLGGVYKTPFDANLEIAETKDTTDVCTITMFGSTSDCSNPSYQSEEVDHVLRMPPSYGLGLSYRHSDTLTFALDVYHTRWSRFILEDEQGNERNPLTGNCINAAGPDSNCAGVNKARLKDTTQVRMGMEYLFIKGKYVIPARVGLFYDPEPADGHLDDFYGFSLGTGVARGRVVMDASYQFRMGNDATGDLQAIEDSRVDIKQHVMMLSLIVYLSK
jgi:long-subunit fatty acid transport protein